MRFRELHVYVKEIRLFQNPFVADIDEAQPSNQFELAELQNCDVLKDTFKPSGLISSIPPSQTTRTPSVHTFWQHVYLRANLFTHETAEKPDEIKINMNICISV